MLMFSSFKESVMQVINMPQDGKKYGWKSWHNTLMSASYLLFRIVETNDTHEYAMEMLILSAMIRNKSCAS